MLILSVTLSLSVSVSGRDCHAGNNNYVFDNFMVNCVRLITCACIPSRFGPRSISISVQMLQLLQIIIYSWKVIETNANYLKARASS